jgi:hypothetical protein
MGFDALSTFSSRCTFAKKAVEVNMYKPGRAEWTKHIKA